jgi:hypothetical protein
VDLGRRHHREAVARMTRYPMLHGRYVVRDGGWYHLYDRPGFILESAAETDAPALEALMALITKLGGTP